jgi:aminoglycoside/choline kinase family phosphotransferase
MDRAVTALVRMQSETSAAGLPAYDADRLGAELDLFPRWYVRQHLGIEPESAWWRDWEVAREALIARALAQPRVFVHRDYMPRNLMVIDPSPGVIDFQDAVLGPITYDLASLLRDAFLSWPEADERRWIGAYEEAARAAGLPVQDPERLRADLDTMAAQRHLKVLGIFARLCHRDGKPGYVEDAPRFLAYLARETGDPELAPLRRVLAALPGSKA